VIVTLFLIKKTCCYLKQKISINLKDKQVKNHYFICIM